jgi:hypothetical protein
MRSALLPGEVADADRGDSMMIPIKEYCDVCKMETARCQYYPAGRSRMHGKCLECDRKDIRNPAPQGSRDSRYCGECDQHHQSVERDRSTDPRFAKKS